MEFNDVFLDMLPKIDLHGFDRDSARVIVNDFVDEAYMMGYDEVLFVHGIGSGIVKNAVADTLRSNKKVISYHIVFGNVGCTVAKISKRNNK